MPEDSEDRGRLDEPQDRHYPLTLPTHYKVYRGNGVVESGSGETLSIGARSVLFRAEHALEIGLRVDLSIEWPMLLDNRVPLQLCVEGEIALCAGKRVLVRALHYDFKVRPSQSKCAIAGTGSKEGSTEGS